MKKFLAIVLLLVMSLTTFAQTTFEPISAKKSGFFGIEQEFLTFPQQLRPGQKFLFTSLLHTTQPSYDVKVVYDFYQNGQPVYTQTFKTNPEYLPTTILEKGTRFETSMYLQFDLTKLKPGMVGIEAYLWGTKTVIAGDGSPTKGIVSTIDVKSFKLLNVIDCSFTVNTCTIDKTGIILSSQPNADNSACTNFQTQACPSGQSCFTDISTGKGACKTACVPKRDASNNFVLSYSGGDCYTSAVDTCGNSVAVNSNGNTCGNQGTCSNGACVGTCSATKIGVTEPCKRYNQCGDVYDVKPNGVACVPSGSSGTSGYICQSGKCVVGQKTTTTTTTTTKDPVVDNVDECSLDSERKDTSCCSGNEYSVAGTTYCGQKPSNVCESDNECAPDGICSNNLCQTRPQEQGSCTVDEYQSCADGSQVMVKSCYGGQLVPIDPLPECPSGGDGGSVLPVDPTNCEPNCSIVQEPESRLGQQLLVVLGLGALAVFVGINYFGKKKRKR